jgi:hypothetical protein
MKTSLINLIGLTVLSLGLAACGSSQTPVVTTANGVTTTCVNGVCTTSGVAGSNLISSGLISFSGTATTLNQTSVVAQQIQVGVSATATSGNIIVTPKVGLNGTFSINEMSNGYGGQISGTIQLSQSALQSLETAFGPSAIVTAMDVWVAQSLTMTSYSSYSGYIAQVYVNLYINGQPIQVIF